METEYIIIDEYCDKCHIDPSFLVLLQEGGLVDLDERDGQKYLPLSELPEVEQYTRLYYDLSINIEGIDAIHNLQKQIKGLHKTIRQLEDRLRLYEDSDEVDNLADTTHFFDDEM